MRAGLTVAGICAFVAVAQAPLYAQRETPRLRVSVAAGLSTYSGNGDVAGPGALLRTALRLESPSGPWSGQVELGYHRFTPWPQKCPTCPGCACTPEAPPSDVWAVALRPQWHLSGRPGGAYLTAGAGAYSPVAPPGDRGRAALGLDVGVGVGRARRGVFCEVRLLRLSNAVTRAWLVPVSVGLLF